MLWGTRPQHAFPSVLRIIRPTRLKYANLGHWLSWSWSLFEFVDATRLTSLIGFSTNSFQNRER
jgi:hypothetical protein